MHDACMHISREHNWEHLYTYVMSLVDSSMESAALLTCINLPLLPLLYATAASRSN
jgi:hypothetical protein